MQSGDKYLTERTAAALLDVSERTLQGWRWRGGGPPFVKLGRAVRYPPIELRAWLDGQRRTSTSDSGEHTR
jgi:predicted DNA-binding transcriptional regulator AlpA